MKFFVNFLSAFRIAAAFAIIPTLMFQMYWTTFILYVLAAASDWFDGYLARKYDVCSKIGGVRFEIKRRGALREGLRRRPCKHFKNILNRRYCARISVNNVAGAAFISQCRPIRGRDKRCAGAAKEAVRN